MRIMLKRVLTFWAMVAVSTVGFAEASFYDGVAATVNDKVITVDTVLQQMRSNFNLGQIPKAELPAKIRELFPVVRDLIIDRMLILKAYTDSGAQLPNEAINERVQNIIASEFEGSEAKLREALRSQRMTYDAWVKQVREDMIVQAMRQLQVGKKVSISPKRVREYFKAHAADFSESGGVHVRTILIPPEKGRTVAEEALKALQAGEAFQDVAKRYSADNKAPEGGDWGFVSPRECFAPQVVAALGALKPGEHSGILEAGGYCSIVQKVAERKGSTPKLKDVWRKVEAAVRNQDGQARYQAWLEGLRKEAYIHVEPVNL